MYITYTRFFLRGDRATLMSQKLGLLCIAMQSPLRGYSFTRRWDLQHVDVALNSRPKNFNLPKL